MKKLKFLILTDHRGHSEQNSLYALSRTLAKDKRTGSVLVASRGDARNKTFFLGDLSAPLYGLPINDTFHFDESGEQFERDGESCSYAEADVVWLRLPPPPDLTFFAALSLRSAAESPMVINNPAGILETGNKSFLHHFPRFTPEVRRISSEADVREFATKFPVVLKPLQEFGGRGLVRIEAGWVEAAGQKIQLDDWLNAVRAELNAGRYLGMKYLKNVGQGDKRILVVNGRILGASLRIPAPGQWLCNVAQGGKSVPAGIDQEEEDMIAAISPILLAKGVVIYGADTLVNDDGKRVLSELNTNSIGGFPQAEAQMGRPILQQTINEIYNYLNDYL